MVWVRRAWRRGVREEPALLRPSKGRPAQIWRIRAGRGAHLFCWWDGELLGGHVGVGLGGHGELLRGSRGDAAGIELGSSFVERISVNTGTASVLPELRPSGAEARAGFIVSRSDRGGAEPS